MTQPGQPGGALRIGSHPTFGRIWKPLSERPRLALKKVKEKVRAVKAKVALVKRTIEQDKAQKRAIEALVASIDELSKRLDEAKQKQRTMLLVEQLNRALKEAIEAAQEAEDVLVIITL